LFLECLGRRILELCRYCYYRRNRRFDANADSYANDDSYANANADSYADAHTGRVHGSGLGRLGHGC
jgi:hypothetical protein